MTTSEPTTSDVTTVPGLPDLTATAEPAPTGPGVTTPHWAGRKPAVPAQLAVVRR